MPQLLTIGYEGRDLDDFVASLKLFKVTRLIDVREAPVSRKKGFSKKPLQERVESEGIGYMLMKTLGTPAPMRNKYKASKDTSTFFESYSEYLSHHMNKVKELHEYLSDGVNCIMCYERDPQMCHRSILAATVKDHFDKNLKIVNI